MVGRGGDGNAQQKGFLYVESDDIWKLERKPRKKVKREIVKRKTVIKKLYKELNSRYWNWKNLRHRVSRWGPVLKKLTDNILKNLKS